MKAFFLTLIFCVSFCGFLVAQAPQAFSYQTVLRDAQGSLVTNQLVKLKITLVENSVLYSEIHLDTTSEQGLVSLEIGRGEPIWGDFLTIDWETTSVSLQVAADLTGGDNFEVLGASELISVPYALFAEKSGSPGPDPDPTNELEMPGNVDFGDIAYYDGNDWNRIPAGQPGSVLTVGEDGHPFWDNHVSVSAPIPALLPNGDTIYVHPGLTGYDSEWGNTFDYGWIPEADLPYYETEIDAVSDFDGESNTQVIVDWFGDNEGQPFAAKICRELTAYGFDDWYLPAAGELKAIYEQLGPEGTNEISISPFDGWWTSTRQNGNDVWFLPPSGIFEPGYGGFDDYAQRCVRKN